MNDVYQSTALQWGNAIDARILSLAVEFYQIDSPKITSITEMVQQWINRLLDEMFVSCVYWNGRQITEQKLYSLLTDAVCAKQGVFWGLEAYAKSSIVYNKKTLNSCFAKRLRGPDFSTGVSVDFPPFWKEHFRRANFTGMDKESLSKIVREGVLKTFSEQSKILRAHYISSDVQFLFKAFPYQNEARLYYGGFQIDFSRFCIGDAIETIANKFCDFAKTLSNEYTNINARVQLQPISATSGNPYLRYFGHGTEHDGSHEDVGFLPKEWYPTYYLPGVEWFNILSPLVQRHIPEVNAGSVAKQDAHIEKLSGGGLLITSPQSIDAYDIPDARKLKRIVYSALNPGGAYYSIRRKLLVDDDEWMFEGLPRYDWAIVPVFEEEVSIVGTDLVIRSLEAW